MGNQCQFQALKQLKVQGFQKVFKTVSNAPSQKYALRLKDKFPPLPQHIQQIRNKLKSPEVQQIIKECPIYFIHHISAVYQGHWKQGKPHGYGRVLYTDLSYYEGLVVNADPDTFINETHHQDGFYIFKDGSYYQGEFKEAKFHGKGVLIANKRKLKIIGDFQNGVPHGVATEIFFLEDRDQNDHTERNQRTDRSQRYQGEFLNGMKSGKGRYYIDDILFYEGDFFDGNMHGKGVLSDYDGSKFIGQFEKGKKVSGQMQLMQGIMGGTYNSEQQSGQGYYEWQDGKFFVGRFKKRRMQGEGKIYIPNGRVIEGIWSQGRNKCVKKIYTISSEQVRRIQQQFKNSIQAMEFRGNNQSSSSSEPNSQVNY